jgi:hypothetical protein
MSWEHADVQFAASIVHVTIKLQLVTNNETNNIMIAHEKTNRSLLYERHMRLYSREDLDRCVSENEQEFYELNKRYKIFRQGFFRER